MASFTENLAKITTPMFLLRNVSACMSKGLCNLADQLHPEITTKVIGVPDVY